MVTAAHARSTTPTTGSPNVEPRKRTIRPAARLTRLSRRVRHLQRVEPPLTGIHRTDALIALNTLALRLERIYFSAWSDTDPADVDADITRIETQLEALERRWVTDPINPLITTTSRSAA